MLMPQNTTRVDLFNICNKCATDNRYAHCLGPPAPRSCEYQSHRACREPRRIVPCYGPCGPHARSISKPLLCLINLQTATFQCS